MRFYNLDPDDVVVLHDEIDLPPAKLRVKTGGGSAGNNGIRSIDAHIGNDYPPRAPRRRQARARRASAHRPCAGRFQQGRQEWLDPLIETIGRQCGAARERATSRHSRTKCIWHSTPSRKSRSPGRRRGLMGFKCGIVGLPNVGKSTLFNALTQTAAAQAANYPFCTIEPNVGDVGVPDRAARCAGADRQVRADHPDAADLRRYRRAWCAAPRRARGSATSSSPISARSTPSPMSCAASRMAMSPMSRADRSDRRHRDDRDRTDARRSRQPGEARRRSGEEAARRRQGSRRSSSTSSTRARPAARGQARPASSSASRKRKRPSRCWGS